MTKMPPLLLARLKHAFALLEQAADPGHHEDAAWIAALNQRQQLDPLAEHGWAAGYIVGVLDGLGVSIAEAVPMIRSTGARHRRRVVEIVPRRIG